MSVKSLDNRGKEEREGKKTKPLFPSKAMLIPPVQGEYDSYRQDPNTTRVQAHSQPFKICSIFLLNKNIVSGVL